ncbi:hypothetical protein ACJMK2_023789 [Sinanodonta woodiana]|uniref:Uncharacterized protein n=1 Tax=Sinanodonta woodiana TaxID=1069815 RepID=A0ABD3T4Y0_SINWO
MKTCVLLLTITVAVVYIKGDVCPSGHATDCTLTACSGNEWVLSCIDGVCTCLHTEGGSHDCRDNGDCGHRHNCTVGQRWRCVQGTCHCIRQN